MKNDKVILKKKILEISLSVGFVFLCRSAKLSPMSEKISAVPTIKDNTANTPNEDGESRRTRRSCPKIAIIFIKTSRETSWTIPLIDLLIINCLYECSLMQIEEPLIIDKKGNCSIHTLFSICILCLFDCGYTCRYEMPNQKVDIFNWAIMT